MSKLSWAGRFVGVLSMVVVFSGAISGCEEFETGDPSFASAESRIINGNTETGWPAVGAMVLSYPYAGFTGSFCTGTLIDKRWVLTAAHCATPSSEFPIAPGIVSFMITSDARPASDGSRPAGTLVQSDYFIPHANWNGENNNYDVALVHLVRDVTEVTPMQVNTASLTRSYEGENFFFTGFGVNNGANETGGGLKRSADIPVSSVDSLVFYTDAYYTAVCFGDSGGPAIFPIGGVDKVVGVNSAVYGSGSDPCRGVGIHVRADSHSTWINQKMSGGIPNCNSNSSVCLCSDACMDDGSCDETKCWTKSCAEVTGCVLGCASTGSGDSCSNECFVTGTEPAREKFDNLMGCFAAKCYQSNTDWQTCMAGKCADRYMDCYYGDKEKVPCSDVFTCYLGCYDSLCRTGCEWQVLESDSAAWDSFKQCFTASCAGKTGSDLTYCVSENCPTQATACLKPDECDLAGGDCPQGEACRQFMAYTTSCFASQGQGVGEKCTVESGKPVPCGDGLACVVGEGGRKCRQVCNKTDGCQEDQVCKGQPYPDLADWGWCGCPDADADTVCADSDCDDSRNDVFPGASELCDGADNNCDGETDEGCTQACTDEDEDGSCQEVDCDDTNAAIRPGAVELCNDALDNDCNGSTDEGCETCVDLDKDGYCADRDCNDRDYRVSPKAAESCDGIDNNCDGRTDEGCQTGGDDVIGDAATGGDEGQTGPTGSSGCSSTNANSVPGFVFFLVAAAVSVMFARRRRV